MTRERCFFETAPILLDDIGPERIHYFYGPRTGLRAVVVIDSTRHGISGGGVRMAPDLSVLETARLARAMTFKYALLEMPTGGAKAGIWLDPAAPERATIIAAFLDAIRPLSESGAFMPGPDMGTSFADFEPLYGSSTPLASLARQHFEGMPLEDQLTGYGIVVAAKTASECLGASLDGARIAIEGFGKVSAGAARFFAREHAHVVAVSTRESTLHDPKGLDVERLISLRAQHGDAALAHYPGATLLAREALFALPADILVPGARPDALHLGNVATVAARLVVPAANIPYAAGTVAALALRGITAVPDFVSNAGGVIAVLAVMSGNDVRATFAAVRARIEGNVRRIFAAAQEQKLTPYDAAIALARQTIARAS